MNDNFRTAAVLDISAHNALSMLEVHGALTIDMQEAIRRGNAENIFICEGAVFFRHTCGVGMLWCENRQIGEYVLRVIGSAFDEYPLRLLVTHGKAAMEAVRDGLGFDVGEACIQFCRLSKEKLPLRFEKDIRMLNMADLAEVNARYNMGGPQHNERAIRDGLMYGIEVEGRLAGFIGLHFEGSVGMMEVFPEYRRRGLGTELESFMHNMHIDKGWVPYGQVYVSNEKSLQMQAKFGLTKSDDFIWWTFSPDMR